MWPAEDLNIIEENETFLKNEIRRIRKTIRDNGPTGEPWPKRPKINAHVLDSPERKQKILCSEDLHQYLIQNCAEDGFILPPPPDGYTTLQGMTPCLITSAEEGGYVFGSVCLSVCLSVRRITRKLVNGF